MLDTKPVSLVADLEIGSGEGAVRRDGGPRSFVPTPTPTRSGYQPSTRAFGPAALGSCLLVGGLVAALAWMNVTVRHAAPQKLLVISLPTMPPPPPHPRAAQPHPDPVPVHPQIVVPPPVVIVPTPPSPIATTAVAVPPVVVPVAAAPAGPPVPVAPPTPAVAEGGDLSSRMIFAKPPSYPLESRRRHEQGTVVLMLLLSADGQVSTISVAESSGSERLDQAALAAVRKWRWAPLVRNGQPVMVQGKVRIPFLLTH